MRITCLAFLFIAISGCAAPNKFQMYSTESTVAYPPISIIVNDGNVYTSTTCGQYGCNSYVDQTHLYALNSLRDTNRFGRVDINNAYSEYKIIMRLDRTSNDSEAIAFSKLMLGAVTLFLVPVSYNIIYESEFTVMHKDQIIGSYAYTRESDELAFLFIEPQSEKKNAINSIISNLMYDLERDDVFNTSKRDFSELSAKGYSGYSGGGPTQPFIWDNNT